MSCIALCNMSGSESFGLVVLEAWVAGKPVILNKNCAAFHDMAVDGENALLVDDSSLKRGIAALVKDSDLCIRLANNGIAVARKFDWVSVTDSFVNHCVSMADRRLRLDGEAFSEKYEQTSQDHPELFTINN
jgi:glycosyltransferase involved in cell wall biosynthesis